MTVGTELLITAEPHLIPGYTGYCPQYRFKYGETYAKVTHKLLLDPAVNHANTLILSNCVTDNNETWRPPKSDINVVNARCKRTDPVFVHPMLPGYEGFIPGLNGRIGQRYMVLATEGLADFERQQLRAKATLHQLKKTIDVQSGRAEPRNLEERSLIKSQFKLPMLAVRAECIAKQFRKHLIYIKKIVNTTLFRKGYASHISHDYEYFGKSIVSSSDNLLYDFTSCRKRQSMEYEPVTVAYPDPPLLIQPSEIYHKHVGMIPNYLGHIPGAVFRYGKTFGADTIDAKRWLQGDSAL
ncbi:CIMIP2 protein GA14893 [Polyergus mexicanus]|uniref:CIMIP2 protein GA14893 n=1 Tax=Polyergus mexicanus TaxID=615972 RepID=UPI0038B50796